MSFVGGNFGFGTGPSSATRFSQTRGRIQGSPVQGVNYPSPFFDVAHTYLPTTVKQMFRWCRYYFLTNPLINATAFKLSEYPVTDIIIDHEDTKIRNQWMEYFQEHLRYRPFQVDCGLDYHVFGNSCTSIGFPFKKFLTCPICKFQERADKIRHRWIFSSYAFRLTCPSCGSTAEAIAEDIYYRNASGINLIRWSCENIEVTYNDITGETVYFYTIPPTVRNDVVIGKKDVVESVPQVFIQAMRQQKGVVFSKDNFFHMKRATLAQQDRGWGIPLILPVLKDAFYLTIMKKAQEALLLEHIVPLRVLFPQAGSGASDPYTTTNLSVWKEQVSMEIARWRMDPNYIPILPLPIGNQTIGGDGRALLLTQEIQTWSDQILMGMGVPLEFIKGGLSFSGSNVSMRMLENGFINYILRQKQQANWVMRSVASFMNWPMAKIRFRPFKMADDLQRKAYRFQLNQAGKISDSTLLADEDLEQEAEDEIMINETARRLEATKRQQLAMAEVQAEVQLVMAKAQAKATQVTQEAMAAPAAPGEPGDAMGEAPQQMPADMQSPLGAAQNLQQPGQAAEGQQQAGMSLVELAQALASQMIQLPPDQQELAYQNLEAQNPELANLVRQFVTQAQQSMPQGVGGATGAAAAQVDTRPLPEIKPPRREAAMV